VTSAGKKKPNFAELAAKQVQRDTNAASAVAPNRFERAQAALGVGASLLDLDSILPRTRSTRECDPEHVRALAESIAALGLIEPIVVDVRHRLLAGEHRLEAIKWLRTENAEAYDKCFGRGVPIRVMDFDADTAGVRALEVEIAENEHRRDYTKTEVRELAERLRGAGYRESVGRPKAGEKALGPALEVVVGKSAKTIRKLLGGASEAPRKERAAPGLEDVLKALERQRLLIPAPLMEHFEALVMGIQSELKDNAI